MVLQNLNGFQSGAKAVLGIYLNHPVNKILSLFADYLVADFLFGPTNVPALNILVNGMWICSLKWNISGKHLEQNITECPDIDSESLFLAINDFWRLVIYGSNKSVSPDHRWVILRKFVLIRLFLCWFSLFIDLPSISKVDNFDVIVLIEHNILWFHISVHDPLVHN